MTDEPTPETAEISPSHPNAAAFVPTPAAAGSLPAMAGPDFTAAAPRVQLIGRTEFMPPAELNFSTDADGGSALVEFAGRACYRSFDKTVPATATNDGYLSHILAVGHLSVLEHGTATFYLTGLSRAATHEITRHRHFSYSELSSRYLPRNGPIAVEPPEISVDPALHQRFSSAIATALEARTELLAVLETVADRAADGALARKQARQIAGSLLPVATATDLVMTGNYRAWRHFIGMRATDAVDIELRRTAVEILRQLQTQASSLFRDFRISRLPDGSEVAASPLVGEG